MLSSRLPKITDKKKKRRGRGGGSGKGFHTTGSGVKGQKSRAGYKKKWWFEGGQNPLVRALPHKRGFKQPAQKKAIGINLLQISKLPETKITADVLRKAYDIPKKTPVKILSKGNVKKKFEIKGVAISASAVRKIESAGGKVQ